MNNKRTIPFTLPTKMEQPIGFFVRAQDVFSDIEMLSVADHKQFTCKLKFSLTVSAANGAAGCVRIWWIPSECRRWESPRYNQDLVGVNESTARDSITISDLDPAACSDDVPLGAICMATTAFVTTDKHVSCVLRVESSDFQYRYRRPGLYALRHAGQPEMSTLKVLPWL